MSLAGSTVASIFTETAFAAMQLLTQTGAGNGKVVQLENWTDTKVPTVNGNGQHALPVSV